MSSLLDNIGSFSKSNYPPNFIENFVSLRNLDLRTSEI